VRKKIAFSPKTKKLFITGPRSTQNPYFIKCF